MWLQALFTRADIERVFTELTPVRIALDANTSERWLWLERPSLVEMVGTEGVRLVTSARVQWDLAGVKIQFTMRTLSVRVTPTIEQQDGSDVLLFGLQIEAADLSAVPGFVETQLISLINETLRAKRDQIVWRFTETLDFHFRMPALSPAMLEAHRQIHLYAHHGAVRIADEGLVVAASFEMDARPGQDIPAQPAVNGAGAVDAVAGGAVDVGAA